MEDISAIGWTMGKELGSGHFAKVYLVTRNTDGQQAACKVIKKPKELKKRDLVKNEHKILTEIDNPYVVKCYDAFETDDRLYLFMELMSGGELFDRIVDMGRKRGARPAAALLRLPLLLLRCCCCGSCCCCGGCCC